MDSQKKTIRSVMLTPAEIQDLREDMKATMESADKYLKERIAKAKEEKEQKLSKKRLNKS